MARFSPHKTTLGDLVSFDFLECKNNVSEHNNKNFEILIDRYYKSICGYVYAIILRRKISIGKLWVKFSYTVDDIAIDSIITASQMDDPTFEDLKKICFSIIESECMNIHLSIEDSFKKKERFSFLSDSEIKRQKRIYIIEERIALGRDVFISKRPKRETPSGTQWCSEHKQFLPSNEFYSEKLHYCKECNKRKNREYKKKRLSGIAPQRGVYLKGENHPKFKGWYFVNGEKFTNSYDAQNKTGINYRSIQRWCKEGKNGCSFIPCK